MSKQYDLSGEAIGGAIELGIVGTLLSSASSLPAATVTVATIGGSAAGAGAATTAAAGAGAAATAAAGAGAVAAGVVATPIVVSLTGVTAVSAAAYLGFSLGKRVVKGINQGLNNNPKPRQQYQRS